MLHRHAPIRLGLLAVLCLSSCTSGPSGPPSSAFVESPQGSVTIEQLAGRGSSATWGGGTRSFQATHPATLNPHLIAAILEGVRIQPQREHPTKRREIDPRAVPVFSKEDQAFLAPAIARALAEVTPDQRVMFRVLRHTATESEITSGTLFVNRPVMQVTLRRYRVKSTYGTETGLEGREVTYAQPEAVVEEAPPQSWILVEPRQATAAVNYETVATLAKVSPYEAPAALVPDRSTVAVPAATPTSPPPASVPTEVSTAPAARPPAGHELELQTMKDVLSKQERELDALREELKSMRQQLTEKDPPAPKPKPSKKAPRSADPAP